MCNIFIYFYFLKVAINYYREPTIFIIKGWGSMKRGVFIIILTIIILTATGCSSSELESFLEERELLINRISDLEEEIAKRDEEIKKLKNLINNITNEVDELEESIIMIKFSEQARFDDYNSFDNLENIYKINSKYIIKDDWYVVQEDYFELELLGYENAKKVDFYILKLESDVGERLIFTDIDNKDGWKYINDDISKVIEKHRKLSSEIFYGPHFVMYTEVTLNDGNVIKTPRLPIYYKTDDVNN